MTVKWKTRGKQGAQLIKVGDRQTGFQMHACHHFFCAFVCSKHTVLRKRRRPVSSRNKSRLSYRPQRKGGKNTLLPVCQRINKKIKRRAEAKKRLRGVRKNRKSGKTGRRSRTRPKATREKCLEELYLWFSFPDKEM